MAIVIFDCDGVLVNTDQISFAVGRQILAEHGIPCFEHDYLKTYLGHTLNRFIELAGEKYTAAFGKPLPHDFRSQTVKRYLIEEAKCLKAVDGAVDLVMRLRCDTKVAVASNSNMVSLERKLRLVGLYDLLKPEWVISSESVSNPKPAPDVYLRAMHTMGETNPCRCLVVDDSVIGVTAAARAGMYVIGFTGGGLRLDNHAQALKDAGAAEVMDTMPEIWARLRHHINRIRRPTPGPAPTL